MGGIYTVLKSKAPAMLERWGDRYCLIGPYMPACAAIEFEETGLPDNGLRAALLEMKSSGIACHYGRWLIPGKPKVILIDHTTRHPFFSDDKYLLWRDNHIETPAGDEEVNTAIAFGFAVTMFFTALAKHQAQTPILAHFHEWQAGVPILRISHLKLPVRTFFTTHATLLGRYIASQSRNFYESLHQIDPERAARDFNIVPRYRLERAAAHGANYFSTISDITAGEARQMLGRSPDAILPNGFNKTRFTALHEFQNLHVRNKEQIHDFVRGHFFPSYPFNLERTLYFFTSGRYEYYNKGMEVFIEALYRLNQRLRSLPAPPTVVVFIITKAATRNINVETLHRQLALGELKKIRDEMIPSIEHAFLHALTLGRFPDYEELLPTDSQTAIKRSIHGFRREGLPAIVTHDMVDSADDPVLRHLRHRNLINHQSDPVKVVFHPDFITPSSPLLGMEYDEFVRGCHLGVFPSYYEPWGYTPLECMALGIPAVTTDVSGFGAYAQSAHPNLKENGLYVLPRAGVSADNSIIALSDYLFDFCGLTLRERIEVRNRAESLSERFDWTHLAKHYHELHDRAL